MIHWYQFPQKLQKNKQIDYVYFFYKIYHYEMSDIMYFLKMLKLYHTYLFYTYHQIDNKFM
jgi:hypothetical protein